MSPLLLLLLLLPRTVWLQVTDPRRSSAGLTAPRQVACRSPKEKDAPRAATSPGTVTLPVGWLSS